MTVQTLIEKLKQFPADMEVKFSYDNKDYWHTVVVKQIENVQTEQIEWSEYHQMYKIADINEGISDCVVLS